MVDAVERRTHGVVVDSTRARRRQWIGGAALVVILCAGCGGGHKLGYVAQNKAILRSFPMYPGGRLWTSYTVFAPKHGNTPPHGMYTTTHQLLLPDGTQCQAALKWYGDMLSRRGWQRIEHLQEFNLYVRKSANASVNCFTDEPSAGPTHPGIELGVNSHRR
jgi:hypothetical protein